MVAKMMAKDPARRFQTPDEVAQALRPFFGKGAVSARVLNPDLSQTGQADYRPDPAAISPKPAPPEPKVPAPPARKPARAAQPEPQWESLIDLREPENLTKGALRPAVAPHWPGWVWPSVGVGLLLLAFLIAWAAGVLKVKTRDGVIVLENLPSDAEVFVDGERITLTWPDGGPPVEITVPVGKHGVQVKKDGFQTLGEEVVLETGGQSRIHVRLVPLPGSVTGNEEAVANAELPKEITSPTTGMKLVLIPAGEFLMGSPDSDNEADPNEKPQHRVRITRPFYMGATEVTVGQFRRFVEATGYRTDAERVGKDARAWTWGWNEQAKKFEIETGPKSSWRDLGFSQSDEHPVVCVSWNDAVAFCEWLTQQEKTTYRLPTEAEWEYACRAGTKTRFWSGDDPMTLAATANVADETAKTWIPNLPIVNGVKDGYIFTAPVGRFRANPWGLFDMHGNVHEWCSDGYDGEYYKRSPDNDPLGAVHSSLRVTRGGGFDWDSRVRSARRTSLSADFTPEGRSCTIGFRIVQVLSDSTNPTPPPSAVPAAKPNATAHPLKEITSSITGMKLVLIPAGEFQVGSKPPHSFLISRAFYLGKYEVTQAEYEKVTGQKPSYFKDQPTHPVEEVSWFDAVAFCNVLSKREGLPEFYRINGEQVEVPGWNSGYRLPTEAEWEYACRAGSTARWSFGDNPADVDAYAWFGGNSGRERWDPVKLEAASKDSRNYFQEIVPRGCRSHPVGQKRPNEWGLFDMHGNVWEWCWDWYDEAYYGHKISKDPTGPSAGKVHVIRGGSWKDLPGNCNSDSRLGWVPLTRYYNFGFRLARTVEPQRDETTTEPAKGAVARANAPAGIILPPVDSNRAQSALSKESSLRAPAPKLAIKLKKGQPLSTAAVVHARSRSPACGAGRSS